MQIRQPLAFYAPTSRRGFTLLELLVVISIIVLLIALLLPTLRKAREAAMNAKCLSNLRQNGVAFRSYADEFRGWLPMPTISGWGGRAMAMAGGKVFHHGLLYPYLGNAETLFCPDVAGVPDAWRGTNTDPAVKAALFRSNWATLNPAQEPTITTYGMPQRWVDPSDPPVYPSPNTSSPFEVYDIYREQNDPKQRIALLIDYNGLPYSKTRRYYPIMGCLQDWYLELYGGHSGERSNLVYPDGRVIPMTFPFRIEREQIFHSSVCWGFFINLYR